VTRVFLFSTALVTGLALPAFAGAPPVTIPASPADVAAICAESPGNTDPIASGGLTGCRNTRTGGAVACDADGRCRDYFADPRYPRIKAILDNARKQQVPAKL